MNIRILPPDGMLEASVDLPLSKSISARVLVINRIGGFETTAPVSDSDDTRVLAEALQHSTGTVNIGHAGTAMRFLTAYYAATPGTDIVLEGSERMHQRPIGILVDALRVLGADIEYLGNEGYPPLRIRGKQLTGGEVALNPTVSSQYVSALMMVAPLMDKPLTLKFDGEPTSLPYIKMTGALMTKAGVEPDYLYNRVEVPNTPYSTPLDYSERDWSAASYWYAIAAISAGWVTLNDMAIGSLQGDSAIKTFGERLGVNTSESEDVEGAVELSAGPEQFSRLDADMADTPDLVPTLAVAAAALGIPFRLTGVHTLRNKETDRLEALRAEALKFGLVFEIERGDVLSWEGARVPMRELPRIATYDDHRMAMAFAPLSIFVPGIVIEDAEVVSKSYPGFWTDLEAAGFTLLDGDEPMPEFTEE